MNNAISFFEMQKYKNINWINKNKKKKFIIN